MDMSAAYLAQTAAHLVKQGFVVQENKNIYGPADRPDATGVAYALTLGEQVAITLEAVSRAEKPDQYYLEIVNYFGLRSYSFELDSWKHFADRAEFKYMANTATGLGLTFILYFARIPRSPV